MFNGTLYRKKIFSFCIHLLMPGLAYGLLVQLLKPWIGDASFFKLSIGKMDALNLLKGFISYNMDVSYCGHLWYLTEYAIILLLFPLLRLICNNKGNVSRIRCYLIVLSIFMLLMTEIQKYIQLPAKIYTFSVFRPSVLLIIIGYELSQHKDRIKSKKFIGVVSIVIYITLQILRTLVQIYAFNQNAADRWWINWASIFGIISSIMLFVAMYSINIKSELFSRIILLLGDKTFGIYLLHVFVLSKLNSMGVQSKLYSLNRGEEGIFIDHLLYSIEYTVVAFVISLVLTVLVKKMRRLIFLKGAIDILK